MAVMSPVLTVDAPYSPSTMAPSAVAVVPTPYLPVCAIAVMA